MTTFWMTGARGFIGRHLARRLAAAGHRVAGLGHGAWAADGAAAWGVSHWIEGEVDVGNLARMQAALGQPGGVFHLAGGSSVGAALADPLEDYRRTVGSTADLLEWMRRDAPAVPMVAVSSAAVYGAGHEGPIAEDAALAPYSPYGAHKFMMEELCRSYAATYGLSIALPRLFSVFGPELRKQLLWDTCSKLVAQGEVELGGSGEELRDWTSVSDAVAVLERLMASADARATVVNVATGRPLPVREVAATLARCWSPASPPPIRFNGRSRPGDPPSLCADVGRLNAMGLSCDASAVDGIADYVAWFRSTKGRA